MSASGIRKTSSTPEFKRFRISFDVVGGLKSLRYKTKTKDFERVVMLPSSQLEEFMKWRLELSTSYRNGGSNVMMKLMLLSISAKISSLDIHVLFEFSDYQFQCKLRSFLSAKLTRTNCFQCVDVCRFEDILKHFKENESFTIFYNVTIRDLLETPIGESFQGFMSIDLSNMLESELFSDVTFIVSDREFKGHRAILAARSPYLKAMLQHNMLEGTSGIVVLEDIDHNVFSELLYYIYTGRVRDLRENAQELLVASAKFCLDNLKEICCEYLGSCLALETVCEIYILSDIYSCKTLKQQSQKFIVENSKNIIHTMAWKNLSKDHPLLMGEICEKLATRSK